MSWFSNLFSRREPEASDSAATLVAAMIDADENCSRWKRHASCYGSGDPRIESGAFTVGIDYVTDKLYLDISLSRVPLALRDRFTLGNAYTAWLGRWDELERHRLLRVTAEAISTSLRPKGNVR